MNSLQEVGPWLPIVPYWVTELCMFVSLSTGAGFLKAYSLQIHGIYLDLFVISIPDIIVNLADLLYFEGL